MIIRRTLGLIMLLTGLTLLVASLAAAYFVGDVLNGFADSVSRSVGVASTSLDTARSTLELARDSIGDVDGGLATAITATAGAARTLDESRPLIDNVAVVTTQEVPEAIEGMQTALPNMIEVAAVIDKTLTTLSSVGIDQTIPLPFGGSIPLRFDLGIDYNPTTPFDESLRVFEASLVGLPESLRGLEDELAATNSNLASLSTDLQATSDNLATINTRMSDLSGLFDQYALLVEDIAGLLGQIETQLGPRLELIRLIAIALLIALGLSQLTPIYLGWELLTGRRDPQPYVENAAAVTDLPAAFTVSDRPLPNDTTDLHPDSAQSPGANTGEETHAQT